MARLRRAWVYHTGELGLGLQTAPFQASFSCTPLVVTPGANATIVCGHELGEYCFVAAGAVVADNVPAFALMAGVPAKRIGWMSHAGQKLSADLVCPQTGRRYRQTGDDVLTEIL